MNALAGTGRLLKLAIRLDRYKLLLWITLTVGMVALTVPQLKEAYPTVENRLAYASATAPSMVTRLLAGAITGPSFGEIVIVETAILAVLMLALLNIFLVTRHTRKNEESGREELLGSMQVGRQALLTSALLLAGLVNLTVCVLLFMVLDANGLPLSGSVAYSVGLGCMGMVFAGISAICAQLFESTRTANTTAALVFGAAFVIRGVGDALGKLGADSMSVYTSWVSYLSPIGWVTNMKPYNSEGAEQWWLLCVFLAAIILTIASAYLLLARRDMGAGIYASKLGRSHASKSLLKPYGLLWRLNKTSFITWLIAMVIFGAMLGGIANEFQDLISGNDQMKQLLGNLSNGGSVSDIMFAATFTIVGIIMSAYTVQLLIRMHAEEASGRLELLLSTSRKRTVWMMRHIAFALGTAFIILLVTGAAAGVVYGAITGDIVGQGLHLAAAILVQFPAIVLVTGLSVLLFGVYQRMFVPLSWACLGIALLIFQLGTVLNLPQLVVNLSPFTHTPPAPAPSIRVLPLVIISVIAFTLLSLGVLGLRRRDVQA